MRDSDAVVVLGPLRRPDVLAGRADAVPEDTTVLVQGEIAHVRRVVRQRLRARSIRPCAPYINLSVDQGTVVEPAIVRGPLDSSWQGSPYIVTQDHATVRNPVGKRHPVDILHIPERIVGVALDRSLLDPERHLLSIRRYDRATEIRHVQQIARFNRLGIGDT